MITGKCQQDTVAVARSLLLKHTCWTCDYISPYSDSRCRVGWIIKEMEDSDSETPAEKTCKYWKLSRWNTGNYKW